MRIAITGPESSGKTALAIQLAESLSIPYCPEAARSYFQNRSPKYTLHDIENIALMQAAWWKKTERFSSSWVADSDYWVMHIWQIEKFGKCSSVVEQSLRYVPFDIVLVCAPDIPWEYDPLRENRDDRDRLFDEYAAVLSANQINSHVVRGLGKDRLANALELIKEKGR
jgi:nicotinamide riboside kinase